MRTSVWMSALCAGAVFAAPPEADYSKGMLDRAAVIATGKAITTNVYPDADAVVVDSVERALYSADGTSVTFEDTAAKVLTEKGKRDLRTLGFAYNVIYGSTDVLRVEVIRPDGTALPVDVAANSREMVDQSQMGMNIYDPNNKVLQVSMPELEVGDIVRYITRDVTVKAFMPGTFSDYTLLEHTMPAKRAVYEVVAANALPLKHHTLKDAVTGTVAATVTTQADTTTYTWTARDVPRMFPEPRMPALHTVVQRVMVSTIPDWETISKWYWNLSARPLAATTPEMSNEVAQLVANAADEQQKIEGIFKRVSQRIRYMGITTEKDAPGFEPHDVCITYNNKYGVCRDKAALLVSMLRIAGLKAYPVLILVGPKKDPDVPQPYFNHAITAVETGDCAYVLMDSTDENTKDLLPAYLGDMSYLVCKPEGDTLRTTPFRPAGDNLVRVKTKGALTSRGDLEAETEVFFDGINDNIYRGFFARSKPEERKRLFEGLVKRVAAGAKLTSFTIAPEDFQDVSEPLTVKLSFEAKDVLVSGKEAVMLSPPWVGMSIGLVNWVLGDAGLEKRRYPFDTEVTCGAKEEFTLDLADAVGAAISLPQYTPVEGKTVEWKRSVVQHGDTLDGSSEFLINVVEFSPEEYLALKETLKTIEFNNRKKPIFAVGAAGSDEEDEPEAFEPPEYAEVNEEDLEIQSDITEYTLHDAHSWTVTHTVKKEVKTYNGMKKNAELKLSYNPVWQSAALRDAVVTDPEGVEKKIGREELNVMDAAWVGGAPRYPAEKTLVASLPGVDVGSVIEYTTVETHSNQPFFSAYQSFNGFDPVVEKKVAIKAPSGLALEIAEELKDAVTAAKDDEDGSVTYEWSAADMPSVKREDDLPPWWSFNAYVLASAGSWPSYAATLSNALCAAAAGQAKAAAKAKELTAGLDTAAARAKAIRDFVARSIRSAGPSFTALPLSSITPADKTLADGYGYTADRAVLLYSMLDAAGMNPAFVLASWLPKVGPASAPLIDTAQRWPFDAMLVRVRVGGDDVYLNDTHQYAELGTTSHDQQPALDIAAGAIITVAAAPGREDRSEQDIDITVAENGDAVIKKTIRKYGTEFAEFHQHFAELSPEERRRYYQETVSGVAQAAKPVGDLVTKYDVYPGVEEFTVSVEKFAVRDGDYLYFAVPVNLANLLLLRADTRDNPLYWDDARRMNVTVNITLPEGFDDIELAPPDVEWTAPADAGTIVVKTTRGDNAATLSIAHDINLKPAIIPADDYSALLDINRTLSHQRMQTILVGKSNK